MGLNKDEGRKIYLSISDGRLARKHQNPIEGVTVERINKLGKTVYEEFFKSLSGRITDIKSKDTDYGKMWEVTLEDDGEEYVISWQYSSRYTNNFFSVLPNVDLESEVKLAPWMMKDKQDSTKKVIGMTIYQAGHPDGKVPKAHTKEEPNGMPLMKKVKRKGKEEWDDSDMLEFFEGLAEAARRGLKESASLSTLDKEYGTKQEPPQEEAPF